MKIIILIFYLLFIFWTCRGTISQNKNYPTINDRKIVWENCFSCHDPVQKSISNISQVMMIEKLGNEGFNSFLKDNFKKDSKNCIVVEHCQIKLTDKEIESVYLYIKESKKYVN